MQVDTRCPALNTDCTAYIKSLYYTISERHQVTPLTEAFFESSNIQFIVAQIEKALHLLTGEQVRISTNEEFAQTMIETAGRNLGLSYTPQTVGALNRAVIEHETRVQYYSLRQRKLFYKYFWFQDRMRVFPYGQYDKVTSGEVTVSPSGYTLSNPWRRWQADYLHDTEGLDVAADSPSGYCKIPGFLQPKVVPVRPVTKPRERLEPSCFPDP